MVGAAIVNGDLAVCEPRQYAENGEIVVALVHQEEATVKRFFRRSDHIELRPENPAFEPMCYGFDEVLVQGKVVGVVRGPGRRLDRGRINAPKLFFKKVFSIWCFVFGEGQRSRTGVSQPKHKTPNTKMSS